MRRKMRLRNIPRAGAVIESSSRVIKEPELKKGKWKSVFERDQPIHIEIGMGKGKFITQMAIEHPGVNYIGIERYQSVLLRALEKKEELPEIPNLYFLCMDARNLAEVFEQGEVHKIYLNFSDPWPKERHAKRRLPSKEFLARYEQILDPEGMVEFKTDNRQLFEFALEQADIAGWNQIACTFDLHQDTVMNEGNIMTEYEEKFSAQGNSIHKVVLKRK